MARLLETLKPLIYVSSYFGILPFYNKILTSQRIYNVVVLIIYIFAFGAGFYQTIDDKVYTINNIIWGITVYANVLIIISSMNSNKYNLLFEHFNYFDKVMLRSFKKPPPELKWFNIRLYGSCVLFLILSIVAYIGLELLASNRLIGYWNFHNYVHWNYCFVKTLVEYYLLKSIKKRLVLLNFVITDLKNDDDKILWVGKVESSNGLAHKINSATELSNSIGNIADVFNDLFGWQLLFMVLYISARILFVIGMIVSTAENTNLVDILNFVPWTTIVFVQGIVISSMCEGVVNEGRKTITVSHKALNRYCEISALRSKLLILAHQTRARCPQFSAAGFFNVDFAMLFTFVNLITTYVIVVIQFAVPKK